MQSKNQYLRELRLEYLKTKSKKKKGELLDEAEKRTGLCRKYLISRKLKPKSNIDKKKENRKKRKVFYDGYFKVALIKIWEVLDHPCGQRLESSLRADIVDKLRQLKELVCSDEVAKKLKKVCAKTIDQKLKHEKEVLRQWQKKGQPKSASLLLKKIPIKIHGEMDLNK